MADWVTYADDVSKEWQLLLCDAQTSGGLIASIPGHQSAEAVKALRNVGLEAAVVGQIEDVGTGKIAVTCAANGGPAMRCRVLLGLLLTALVFGLPTMTPWCVPKKTCCRER